MDGAVWDRARVADWMAPTYAWAKAHRVRPSRIVAAEFGCHRRSPGCAEYLDDVLRAVETRRSHWAVYSFREDGYDGYDYELGDAPPPQGYWEAKERGELMSLPRGPNPVWEPVSRRLARRRSHSPPAAPGESQ